VASLERDQVIAYLSALSPDELNDLVLDLEERLGLERVALWPWGDPTMGAPLSIEEIGIPAFDVVLLDAQEARIPVMKALRARLAMDLEDVRSLVDRCPVVVGEQLAREEAIELQQVIEAAGGRAEIR